MKAKNRQGVESVGVWIPDLGCRAIYYLALFENTYECTINPSFTLATGHFMRFRQEIYPGCAENIFRGKQGVNGQTSGREWACSSGSAVPGVIVLETDCHCWED